MPTLGGITIKKTEQGNPKAPITSIPASNLTIKGSSSNNSINIGGLTGTKKL